MNITERARQQLAEAESAYHHHFETALQCDGDERESHLDSAGDCMIAVDVLRDLLRPVDEAPASASQDYAGNGQAEPQRAAVAQTTIDRLKKFSDALESGKPLGEFGYRVIEIEMVSQDSCDNCGFKGLLPHPADESPMQYVHGDAICPECPPADALIAMARSQPAAGGDGLRLVKQKHARGCGPAALAMITRETYESVCGWFGHDFEENGVHSPDVIAYLADHGFATATRKRFVNRGGERADRPNWPPQPSGHVELLHVCVHETSPVTHFAVRRPDGVILDPILGEHSNGLAVYHRVDSVSTVHMTASKPQHPCPVGNVAPVRVTVGTVNPAPTFEDIYAAVRAGFDRAGYTMGSSVVRSIAIGAAKHLCIPFPTEAKPAPPGPPNPPKGATPREVG